jgi:hypothetical protein
VRAPDRSGGDVGQLHVDLVELGRAGVEQPDTTEALVDVAQASRAVRSAWSTRSPLRTASRQSPSPNSMCRARRVV